MRVRGLIEHSVVAGKLVDLMWRAQSSSEEMATLSRKVLMVAMVCRQFGGIQSAVLDQTLKLIRHSYQRQRDDASGVAEWSHSSLAWC